VTVGQFCGQTDKGQSYVRYIQCLRCGQGLNDCPPERFHDHGALFLQGEESFPNRRPAHLEQLRLLLPPSPCPDREELGLHLEKTPSGHYERGGSGRNLFEADIIAEAVEKHVKQRPMSSLGIACFSIAQREAIYEALRRRGILNEAETFAPKDERYSLKI
jgi:hypothetical protein